MKKDYIYMVVKELTYHDCKIGDLLIGTGRELLPGIPPRIHAYEREPGLPGVNTQWIESIEVTEIGPL